MDLLLAASLVVGIIVLGLAAVYAVGAFNALVQTRQNVSKAWGDVDVLLKQRHDELPALVEVVKGSAKHEAELMERITRLRAEYEGAADSAAKAALENRLNREMTVLRARMEAYPDLKSNAAFLKLQERITRLEDQIAARREFFNESVRVYNTLGEQFPARLLARTMRFAPHAYLEAPGAAREPAAVDFTP